MHNHSVPGPSTHRRYSHLNPHSNPTSNPQQNHTSHYPINQEPHYPPYHLFPQPISHTQIIHQQTKTSGQGTPTSNEQGEEEDSEDDQGFVDKSMSKAEVKKEKNRVKQRNLRLRRANHITDLEEKVQSLKKDNITLTTSITNLKSREKQLEDWAQALETQLYTYNHGMVNTIRQRFGFPILTSSSSNRHTDIVEGKRNERHRSRRDGAELLDTLAQAATVASRSSRGLSQADLSPTSIPSLPWVQHRVEMKDMQGNKDPPRNQDIAEMMDPRQKQGVRGSKRKWSGAITDDRNHRPLHPSLDQPNWPHLDRGISQDQQTSPGWQPDQPRQSSSIDTSSSQTFQQQPSGIYSMGETPNQASNQDDSASFFSPNRYLPHSSDSEVTGLSLSGNPADQTTSSTFSRPTDTSTSFPSLLSPRSIKISDLLSPSQESAVPSQIYVPSSNSSFLPTLSPPIPSTFQQESMSQGDVPELVVDLPVPGMMSRTASSQGSFSSVQSLPMSFDGRIGFPQSGGYSGEMMKQMSDGSLFSSPQYGPDNTFYTWDGFRTSTQPLFGYTPPAGTWGQPLPNGYQIDLDRSYGLGLTIPNDPLSQQTTSAISRAQSLLLSLYPNPLPIPLPPLTNQVLTSDQQICLLLGLGGLSTPAMRASYRNEQIKHLPAPYRASLKAYELSPSADLRILLFPIAILRVACINLLKYHTTSNLPLTTIQQGNHQKKHLGLTRFVSDFLFRAKIYGDVEDDDSWDVDENFWDDWDDFFPRGRAYCKSIEGWRRRDGLKGSGIGEILLGLESGEKRRKGPTGKPPGWKIG